VLVVEDEPGIRTQIVEALQDLGCIVRAAEDGPTGLQEVRSPGPIDLLITDIGLPGLNGRQLADGARISRPGLPVLFITGYAGTALDGSPLTAGMEIMHKPFTVDRLTARAGALLKAALAR
jgi:DNA-binding response OmpR family regulator